MKAQNPRRWRTWVCAKGGPYGQKGQNLEAHMVMTGPN